MPSSETDDYKDLRPDVLNYDDIRALIPRLDGHEKLVNVLLHFLSVDKVNAVHSKLMDTPGPEFVRRILFEEFRIKLRIDNEERLEHLPEGAFITVSNHPFGALDGITLIYLITRHRPKFRVMVNLILNRITAMRPNFIAVDAMASDDPSKRQVSVNGIRQALRQLREGEPVGFFPAGAMSTINWRGRLLDRQWQPTVIQIIRKANVPVIPIFFHGSNSWWCNILGKVCWPARSLRLPAEVWRKIGKEIHVSIGEPISPEEQVAHGGSVEELGRFLREKTYELRERYH